MLGRVPTTTPTALDRYERRSNLPMLGLGLLFVAVYAVDVLATGLGERTRTALDVLSWLIWAVFVVDFAARVWLSEDRVRYVLRHPVDLAVVVLPPLRSLRVLRVFTAGHAIISRGGQLSLLRSAEAIALTVGLLVFIAALAELDAERGAPDSKVEDLGDALWWAVTTVTTVGYGDIFPVTGTGRVVAVALMLVGISLVGVITATIAGWFVAQTDRARQDEDAALSARLDRIEAMLEELTGRSASEQPAGGQQPQA